MRRFKNITAFVEHLATLPLAVDAAKRRGLMRAGEMIRDEAKREIGTYQEAIGPLPAWTPLSDATLNGFYAVGIGRVPGKEELGYSPPDNPLARTWELQEAIRSSSDDRKAAVGVLPGELGDIAKWQELGTPDARFPIPPRSFLAGAAMREEEKVVNQLTGRIVWALCGNPPRNS